MPSSMSASKISAVRSALGLTQLELASLLGVHSITVSKWEGGRLAPSPYQVRFLEAFARSHKADPRVGAEVLETMQNRGVVAALYCALRPGLVPERGGHA